jgi:hypothetical protein
MGVVDPVDDEFGVDDEGRLDLFGDSAERGPSVDKLIDAGWDPCDHGDPAADPDDDDDAWLASMPAELRAEVLARPVLPAPRPGASALERVGGVAAFSDGGFCDTMLPGPRLGEMLAEAWSEGFPRLSDDVLAGMLRASQRQVSCGQSEVARLAAEIARRRVEQAAGRAGRGWPSTLLMSWRWS